MSAPLPLCLLNKIWNDLFLLSQFTFHEASHAGWVSYSSVSTLAITPKPSALSSVHTHQCGNIYLCSSLIFSTCRKSIFKNPRNCILRHKHSPGSVFYHKVVQADMFADRGIFTPPEDREQHDHAHWWGVFVHLMSVSQIITLFYSIAPVWSPQLMRGVRYCDFFRLSLKALGPSTLPKTEKF